MNSTSGYGSGKLIPSDWKRFLFLFYNETIERYAISWRKTIEILATCKKATPTLMFDSTYTNPVAKSEIEKGRKNDEDATVAAAAANAVAAAAAAAASAAADNKTGMVGVRDVKGSRRKGGSWWEFDGWRSRILRYILGRREHRSNFSERASIFCWNKSVSWQQHLL